jgi:hypothetical protein
MLEARGGRRRTGGPVFGPVAAIRERQSMRGVEHTAVALIGFSGGAVIIDGDGKVQQCPIEELRIWNDDIAAAIAVAQDRIEAG